MEKLGIDTVLIFVQIINFALLFYVLRRVLYKPILTTIKDRREKLESVDKGKKALNEEKEKFETQKSEKLRSLELERKKVLDDARKQAEEKAKEILEQANKKSRETLREADLEIEREKAQNKKDLDEEVLTLAVAMIKKASSNLLSERSQKESMQLAIKQFKKLNDKVSS